MYILAVDDEQILRKDLVNELKKVFPQSHIIEGGSGEEALQAVKELILQGEKFTYAFMDIELQDMNGIQLAVKVKNLLPDIKLIFCTAYEGYAKQAYDIYSKGYIMKPITERKIIKNLDEMVTDWRSGVDSKDVNICIQTFGHFEVFVDDKPLVFHREKAKELFAYLVDRRGASVTNGDIASIIWEDRPCDSVVMN